VHTVNIQTVVHSVYSLSYGLDDQGSFPIRVKDIFPMLLHPDWLWSPPSILPN